MVEGACKFESERSGHPPMLAFWAGTKLCGLNLVHFCPNVGTDPQRGFHALLAEI